MSALPSTPQLESPATARQSLHWLWSLFFACAIVAFGLFFIPVFIIRPFRYQAPRSLLIAIAGIACLLCAFLLWRAVGRWRKALIVLAMFVVTISAVMARLNHFEWMF